ncbi:MAG: response regulator [Planctomycetota bacterium]|nr:MAG: response regulator [Planctomycetota bacterium]
MARILVVDDSPMERRLAGALLKRAGHEPVPACDGREALEKVRLVPIDVVLVDLVMPGMDGLELLAEIRATHPRLPVIIFTSYGSEEVAAEALRKGASGYVPKRHAGKMLVPTIDSVVEVSRRHAQQERIKQRLDELTARFTLPNDRGELTAVVAFCQQLAADYGFCDDGEWTRIGVALTEALVNAMVHGNLEISSDCRLDDDGTYDRLIEERRQTEPYASRRVRVIVRLKRDEVRFTIRDEGPGFDPSAVPDPTAPENVGKPCGRGLLLIRSFMDEVWHADNGREITMVKRRAAAEETTVSSEPVRAEPACATS